MDGDGEGLGEGGALERQPLGQDADHVFLDHEQLGGSALSVGEARGAAEIVATRAQVRALLEARHRGAEARGVHGDGRAGARRPEGSRSTSADSS